MLWIFSISAGVGADLNFGSSEIIPGADRVLSLTLP